MEIARLIGVSAVFVLVQFLAAVPWIVVLNRDHSITLWAQLRRGLRPFLLSFAVITAFVAAGYKIEQDYDVLKTLGRAYGCVLYLQLILDFFVLVFGILLLVWPRAAAVAMAAFREGVRQPMFWFFIILATLILLVMPFIPYFT